MITRNPVEFEDTQTSTKIQRNQAGSSLDSGFAEENSQSRLLGRAEEGSPSSSRQQEDEASPHQKNWTSTINTHGSATKTERATAEDKTTAVVQRMVIEVNESDATQLRDEQRWAREELSRDKVRSLELPMSQELLHPPQCSLGEEATRELACY